MSFGANCEHRIGSFERSRVPGNSEMFKSHVICGGHSSGKLCRHGINVCMCGYPKLQPAALDTILEEQESASLGARASG